MTRLQDALERRDQAFFFARDHGRMDRRGNRLTLCALDEFLSIMFAHNSYAGREEWLCEIWFTPGGFSNRDEGRGHKCLSVSWNSYREYDLTNFKRGEWEDKCMTLNHEKFRIGQKGMHNEYVSSRAEEMLAFANQNPGEFLRRQNGISPSPGANIPRIFGIRHRAVNLEDMPTADIE